MKTFLNLRAATITDLESNECLPFNQSFNHECVIGDFSRGYVRVLIEEPEPQRVAVSFFDQAVQRPATYGSRRQELGIIWPACNHWRRVGSNDNVDTGFDHQAFRIRCLDTYLSGPRITWGQENAGSLPR